MTADDKPGNASADRWREIFEKNRKETDAPLTRLEVRAEMRSAGDFEEDSSVIHLKTEERLAVQRALESDSPPSKASPTVIVLTMVRKFPAWGAVLVALAAIAAYVYLHRP